MTKLKSKTFNKSGLDKYRGLISLVVLFLILTVSMLISSIYVTNDQNAYAKEILVATRQSRLMQQLSKISLDLDLYMRDLSGATDEKNVVLLDQLPQSALYALDELKVTRNQFEATLSAFEKGGIIQLTYEEVKVRPLTRDIEIKRLAEIRNTWNSYMGLIDSYIAETAVGKLSRQTTEYLVDYARLYNIKIMAAAIELNQMIRDDLEANTRFWSRIQLAGIIGAFLLFGFIVFGAMRQLISNDYKLAVANQEMGEIMSSVREGLFLIDKDLYIAGQYSNSLEQILGQKDLANKNLLDILRNLVPESEIETTKIFIDQLYSDWVEVDLIEDLNPLHRISVQDEKTSSLKFLDFKFFRVWLDGKIERVLVSVTDTTENVMLQASLDAQKEQEGRELEMLNIILNTDPTVMQTFVTGSLARLNDINQVLKSPESNQTELRSKVQYIARLIHSVKGEASSLKLHRMVDICETFEESLKSMRNSNSLTGQDFLGLVVLLEDLYRLFDVLQNYSGRVNADGQHHADSNHTPEQAVRKMAQSQESYFKNFVHDMAKRVGKQAQLWLDGFDNVPVSQEQLAQLKDIAIQLLRNSVIHGIEEPAVRAERHKPAMGQLKLSLTQQEDGQIVLTAEDDGNGINFDAIRNKAIALGWVSEEEALKLDERKLLNFMFSNGFSTAQEETEDAGRGVGMDIIKDTIQKMGGKINVSTAPRAYTRFTMVFPASK